MSQAKTKTNGATPPEGPTPSATTLAIKEQMAALQERLAAETERDRERDQLAAFITARPHLTRRDLLDVAERLRPKRGKHAAKSGMRIGFTPPAASTIKGKVGRLIVDGRKAKNLSRPQLASLLKTHPSSVAYWETGRGFPSDKVTGKLAGLFGKPASAFVAS
jgi:ribosome-binding protein aMBF1 (putative translation factor)